MKLNKKLLINIEHEISMAELSGQIVRTLSYDQIIKFITELDLACQDWCVTDKLCKHFNKQMKKLNEEEKGLHIQENN